MRFYKDLHSSCDNVHSFYHRGINLMQAKNQGSKVKTDFIHCHIHTVTVNTSTSASHCMDLGKCTITIMPIS